MVTEIVNSADGERFELTWNRVYDDGESAGTMLEDSTNCVSVLKR